MSAVRLALIFVVAHAASALAFLVDRAPSTAAALSGLPLDDAWIHLVYARSLAALHGFAFNPGQLETGSTSPLWSMALVPATWLARALDMSVVVPGKITGVLVGVSASLAASRLLRSLRCGPAAQVAVGLLFAFEPALAFAQVSGMEVMLAAALALWLLAALVAGRYRLAALVAGLAPLARPELAALTLGALVVLELALRRGHAPWRERLLVLAPAIVLVGAWMVYCLAVSGYPLPSTFYAKFSTRQEFVAHNLSLLVTDVVPSWPWAVYGAQLVFFSAGAVILFRRGPGEKLVAAAPLVYFIVVAASQAQRESLPFYWRRYWLPGEALLLPTVVLGAAATCGWLWQRRQRRATLVPVLAFAVILLAGLARWPSALRASADLYAWNCQNIDELDVAMALWLREHTAPGETIAVTDAGAARYFSDRRIVDLVGLNNHRMLHGERSLVGTDVLSTFPSWLPALRTSTAWQAVHAVATEHLTICHCDQSQLVAYRRVVREGPAKEKLAPIPAVDLDSAATRGPRTR